MVCACHYLGIRYLIMIITYCLLWKILDTSLPSIVLGRGTSTYDGTAIASGVCVELAKRGCRVIFSTHYHSLVHHLSSYPGIMLGHMVRIVLIYVFVQKWTLFLVGTYSYEPLCRHNWTCIVERSHYAYEYGSFSYKILLYLNKLSIWLRG